MTQRYTPAQQWMHWATIPCVAGALAIAWVFSHIGDGDSLTEPLFAWHETLGLTAFVLAVARLASRHRSPAPPLPPTLARWERLVAKATYALLYALLVWMPVTGFIATTAYGDPPRLFNFIHTPALFAKNEHLNAIAGALHRGAQWLLYALLIVHVAGVVFQIAVRRSGLLARMLPPGAIEPRA
jgi:cytochrome b561